VKRTPITKAKKCKICRDEFLPRSQMQSVCSPMCALKKVTADKARQEAKKAIAERKLTREKLLNLKPLKFWKKKAKTALHAYIRARDEGKECASCETILRKLGRVGGDYDAGHFRSVGSAKHMEMVELNIWGQCKSCNDFGNGMFQAYEEKLVTRIGREAVDALKNDNEPRRYRKEDYQQIEAHYKAKLKELKNDR